MNALSKLRSRESRYDIVMVVAEQLQDMNIEITAYVVARALDCSHVTARKYLRELAAQNRLRKTIVEMKHCTKEVFKVTEPVDRELREYTARYLNRYHMEKAQK